MASSDSPAFRYTASRQDRVVIYHHDRAVTTLNGKAATRFLVKAESADEATRQGLMARVTGNSKRGNERLGKS